MVESVLAEGVPPPSEPVRSGLAALLHRARALLLDQVVRVALVVSDVVLRTAGLERAVRLVGANLGTTGRDGSSGTRLADISRARLALVGVIMRRRRLWTRTVGPCLRQALLVSLVLRRYRPVIHLGLRTGDAGPTAHAWVTVGEVRIDYDPSYAAFAAASPRSPVPG